jgi:hypothetical protein
LFGRGRMIRGIGHAPLCRRFAELAGV